MDRFVKEYQYYEYKNLRFSNVDDCTIKLTERQGLRIIHNNIRSVRKNFDDFQVLLQRLNVNFDLIAFSETWKLVNHENFELAGYTTLYNFGDFNQNDGVLVFIKNSLNFTYEIINIDQIKCLRICIKKMPKNYFVTVIYRSPASDVESFNINLNTYLTEKCIYQDEIILGDININILEDTATVNNYLNNMYQAGFLQCINDYTRIQNDHKSCIDHIFMKTKINKNEIIPIILESTVTDHFSVIIQINMHEIRASSKVYGRKEIINYVKLREYLKNENWNDVFLEDDLDEITKGFVNKLSEYVGFCKTAISRKISNVSRKPWITSGLIKSIKIRDELFQRYKNTKNLDLYQRYKNYRNKINSLISKTKASYYKAKINENPKDGKLLWKMINDSLNKTSQADPIKSLKVNDNNLTSEKQIANEFNDYYINIAEKMANNITNNNACRSGKSITPKCKNSIFLKPIDITETKGYIFELKISKSPGIDEITARTLREVADYIAPPLTQIINLCFEQSNCPEHFKTAIVRPLHKGGDKQLMENYRPISLLSNVGKIFEKALKKRMVDFLLKNDLLSNRQFGFKKNVSTQDAIAHLTHLIYNNIDRSTPSIAVFIDLAKAFDTISHTKLLEKLNHMGIRGNARQLIENYLKNRKQYVKIGDTLSDPLIIKNGVPQGTVLGPILFIIYINDLLAYKSSGTILSYADDTVILYNDENWSNLKNKVSQDLKGIKDWLDINLLTMNVKKTKFLPFASYRNSLPAYTHIPLHNSNCNDDKCKCKTYIEKTETFKYLGVTIDMNLKWETHICSLVKKLRSFCYVFKQLREFLPTKSLKQVYCALIESHLTYGIIGWGGVYKTKLNDLEVIQKLLIKIIFRKNLRFSSHELFFETKIFDIRQLYCKVLLEHIYKNPNLINTHIPEKMYSTRSKENKTIDYPIVRKSHGKRSHAFLAVKVYNILPKFIKEEKSSRKYSRCIKEWLLSRPRLELHHLFE